MSDYARVALAREILQCGYQRSIWVDIDVVIFDPMRFQANNGARESALTAEVWYDSADCERLPNPLPLALTLEEDKRLLRHRLQTPASTDSGLQTGLLQERSQRCLDSERRR